MTNDLLPLSSLTDEELLALAYNSRNKDTTALTVELATRLEHALDELRKPRAAHGNDT